MPKKNLIWDYFVKSNLNLCKAQCNIYNKLLSLGSDKAKNQTVHDLKQHLSKFHSEQYRQYLKRYHEEAQERQEQSETRVKHQRLQSNLTNITNKSNNVQITIPNLIKRGAGTFWLIDMLPYSIVESNAFKS